MNAFYDRPLNHGINHMSYMVKNEDIIMPLNIISLGAGVQSSTMALMAAHGEITPMPDRAIFADTQAEPKAVYVWLDWLEKQLPFPVIRVTQGNLTATIAQVRPQGKFLRVDIPAFVNASGSYKYVSFIGSTPEGWIEKLKGAGFRRVKDDLTDEDNEIMSFLDIDTSEVWHAMDGAEVSAVATEALEEGAVVGTELKTMAPAPVNRSCTRDYKIVPIMREVRRILGITGKRAGTDIRVIQWIGISLDESHRMKPSRDPWSQHRFPLIDLGMTRGDCLKWIEAKGYPRPPKSSCVYCPFHSDEQWAALTPEELATAIEVDERLRAFPPRQYRLMGSLWLHRSCKPLKDVVFQPDPNATDFFGNECEGMCGV